MTTTNRNRSLAILSVFFIFTLVLSPVASAAAIRPGFNGTNFPANDDGSAGPVALGFTANFFGSPFTTTFVNNNGNFTFGASLSTFTPFALTGATALPIIAPFFGDVDTRLGNTTRYGAGTVNGRPAFGATWLNVRHYSVFGGSPTPPNTNSFQGILVDRSDIGAGDFDIEFNIDQVQWEAGQASGSNSAGLGGSAARMGYSNGTGVAGSFFELPGSGVNGAFLDSNGATGLIHNSLGSNVLGRYRFAARNGQVIVIPPGPTVPGPTVVPEPSTFFLLATGLLPFLRRFWNRTAA